MKLFETVNLMILLFTLMIGIFIGISFYNMNKDLTDFQNLVS